MIRATHPSVPILMLCGSAICEEVMNLVDGFLPKGAAVTELASEVDRFFTQFPLR